MADLELERDTSTPWTGLDRTTTEAYRGKERRRGIDRRQHGDRREQVRFDLKGGDRRSGKERRKAGGWGGGEEDRW